MLRTCGTERASSVSGGGLRWIKGGSRGECTFTAVADGADVPRFSRLDVADRGGSHACRVGLARGRRDVRRRAQANIELLLDENEKRHVDSTERGSRAAGSPFD
jgi:hypothetical protein